MWKTPEETKKGLECCYSAVEPMMRCEQCPYYGSIVCKMHLHADSIDIIQQLEAKVPRWISVEERLPEPDVFVLVGYKRYDHVFEGCYLEDEKYWCDREYSYIAPPSHWMPLPEPPKEPEA